MPVYEYKCPSCGLITSKTLPIVKSEAWFGSSYYVPGLNTSECCPDCKIEMKRLYSPAAVIIK
jgi:predicted nucleic acid-binding Zn ribbon protein